MTIYTSILALGLLLTLTALPMTAAAGAQTAPDQPDAPSLYRGSGR